MLKIALHDAEYDHMKKKVFPNLALMKISTFHKNRGNLVEWWDKEKSYDIVYSSKVFDFTPINKDLPPNTLKGGTGYGKFKDLPKEIDILKADYSIYPRCDFAIGYLTRGCPNRCKWCVVPRKEGDIQNYAKWQDIVREDSKKLVLMDNNILASPYGISQLEELAETDYLIDLNQGMDIRLLNDDICIILKKLKWLNYIRFSCDSMSQVPYFENLIELFKKHKLPKSKVFIYTLITSDLTEANERIQSLYNIYKNFNLYAQAERNDSLGIVPNQLQKEFANRYVYSRCYKKETWFEYCNRHNIN